MQTVIRIETCCPVTSAGASFLWIISPRDHHVTHHSTGATDAALTLASAAAAVAPSRAEPLGGGPERGTAATEPALAAAPGPEAELYIGVMSGTSLDGVDVVLADLSGRQVSLVGHLRREFAPELLTVLSALQSSTKDELHRAALAAQHLAHTYSLAISELLHRSGIEPSQVRAAGIHGQTVRHRPDAGYTIQLNAPATVAELTGIDVPTAWRRAGPTNDATPVDCLGCCVA